MTRSLLTCVVLLALVGTSRATGTGLLRGDVKDFVGADFARVTVIVHDDGQDDRQAQTFLQVRTDEKGRFELRLSVGFYDVCFLSRGFIPECRKVQLKEVVNPAVHVILRPEPREAVSLIAVLSRRPQCSG